MTFELGMLIANLGAVAIFLSFLCVAFRVIVWRMEQGPVLVNMESGTKVIMASWLALIVSVVLFCVGFTTCAAGMFLAHQS